MKASGSRGEGGPRAHERIERLIALAREIHAARADLQEAFSLEDDAGRAAYWFWLHWHGTQDAMCAWAPALRELIWPYPPEHLRARVVGELTSDQAFSQSGLVNWKALREALLRGGYDPEAGGRVLDFGVGCGRILRYFGLDARRCSFVGADVDAPAVAWCREHLPFAEFAELPMEPPSPHGDGEFTAVYAYSVFTHLPRARWEAWIRELHRILRPGGVLVITLMGETAARIICAGERQYSHPPPEVMRSSLEDVLREGFRFFPYKSLVSPYAENTEHFEDWDLDLYGTTFVTESFLRDHLAGLFDVVEHVAAADGWQDHCTLLRCG